MMFLQGMDVIFKVIFFGIYPIHDLFMVGAVATLDPLMKDPMLKSKEFSLPF